MLQRAVRHVVHEFELRSEQLAAQRYIDRLVGSLSEVLDGF